MFKFIRNLIYRLQRLFLWLWNQEGTSGERARGLAAGVFSGFFPLFGVQTLLGIALAKLLRGNILLAVIGTWISNPITYLPLYWINYQIGTYILVSEPSDDVLRQFSLRDVWSQGLLFSGRLVVGSMLAGLVTSIVVGIIIYVLLERLSKRKRKRYDA